MTAVCHRLMRQTLGGGDANVLNDCAAAVGPDQVNLASDVAWINPFLDGADALEMAIAGRRFAERVVSDLLRSGAARWQDDRLISTVPHSRVSS